MSTAKRFLLLVFSVCMLFTAGCSKRDKNELLGELAKDNALWGDLSVSESDIDYFSSIPPKDYGGREFVIAATEPNLVTSDNGEGVLGEFLFERKSAIEEKFNIKLTFKIASASEIQLGLQNAKRNGESYCDLIYAPMSAISNMSGNGLILNLYSLPFFDETAPYIDSEEIKLLSQGQRAYGIYGDTAFDDRAMFCVFYNTEHTKELGYDVDSLVRDGKWTWDVFLEISKKSVKNLDGKGSLSPKLDRYGYSCTDNTSLLPQVIFASFGKRYFSFDNDHHSYMDFEAESKNSYITKIKEISKTNKSKYPVSKPGEDAIEAFSDGRLTFFIEKLSYTQLLSDAKADWGILPLPKRDEEQESYSCLIDMSVCGFCVPKTCSDTDAAGEILSALCAYSYGRSENVFKKAWTYYYLRDNESALMLDEICKYEHYDTAYAFGEGYPEFAIASYKLLSSVIENDLSFNTQYNQNKAPFYSFTKKEFAN